MIYIVRHGQTELNKKNVLQGRSDHALNEEGRSQANDLAVKFQRAGIIFDHVYSSPLQRAIETAKIVSGKEDVKVDIRLIEMDYGPYEGIDLKSPPSEVLFFFSDFVNNPAPEGMEPLWKIVERMGTFVKEIADESEKGNVLISTHAIAMKGALEYLSPGSNGSYWSKYIGNCAVYRAQYSGGRFTVPEEMHL